MGTEVTERKHYHWKFLAINTGQIDPVEVSVIDCQTEDEAVEAVRRLVKRDRYELKHVFECNTCRVQNRTADAVSRLADAAHPESLQ